MVVLISLSARFAKITEPQFLILFAKYAKFHQENFPFRFIKNLSNFSIIRIDFNFCLAEFM